MLSFSNLGDKLRFIQNNTSGYLGSGYRIAFNYNYFENKGGKLLKVSILQASGLFQPFIIFGKNQDFTIETSAYTKLGQLNTGSIEIDISQYKYIAIVSSVNVSSVNDASNVGNYTYECELLFIIQKIEHIFNIFRCVKNRDTIFL